MPELTVLHTGDLHGKLSSTIADKIRALKTKLPGCLLLDAGDAVTSGNIYFRPGGEPILRLMSEAGYDAMTMGNREFHFLASGFKSKVSLAQFPVLCTNIRCKNSSSSLPVIHSTFFDIADVRVAVFGLTVPMITPGMLASKVSPYVFDDPIEAAKQVVPKLKDSSDVLIALTHIGIDKDVELAELVPGIDLIVGGHTHLASHGPKLVAGTPIVHAGCWGRYLGRVRMTTLSGEWKVSAELLDLQKVEDF